jgi:hypothetical protein
MASPAVALATFLPNPYPMGRDETIRCIILVGQITVPPVLPAALAGLEQVPSGQTPIAAGATALYETGGIPIVLVDDVAPAWSSSITYPVGAKVVYTAPTPQSFYVSIKNTPLNPNLDQEPDTQTTYWQLVATPAGGLISPSDYSWTFDTWGTSPNTSTIGHTSEAFWSDVFSGASSGYTYVVNAKGLLQIFASNGSEITGGNAVPQAVYQDTIVARLEFQK